jgi:chromosome segregation ATPase
MCAFEIVPTHSINKIKSLEDRNRQLENEISDLIREKAKIDEVIREHRNEIMENIMRKQKIEDRLKKWQKLPSNP